MDARRLLIATAALPLALVATPLAASEAQWRESAASPEVGALPFQPTARSRGARSSARSQVSGQAAIAAANRTAVTASRADRFSEGLQVFDYAPGRIFEVWTAPLRVTTLTLGEGEAVLAMAAGDTVRWQVGETASGEGESRRTHVLVKPLETGLQTNLVVTTNRRAYLILLRSGGAASFNAAVAWTPDRPRPAPTTNPAPAKAAEPASLQAFDAAYQITPQGRRPEWAPTAVFTDGVRTFIAFPPSLGDQAPVLHALGGDGQRQLVNYRQRGALLVVDHVIDRAELRLGSPRPRVVKIARIAGAGS